MALIPTPEQPLVAGVLKHAKAYIIGAIGGLLLSILSALGAYSLGWLDSSVRDIVFRSTVIKPGTKDRSTTRAENGHYRFSVRCNDGEKITGGYCNLNLAVGNGTLLNTNIKDGEFSCTYAPLPGGAPPTGEATAICLAPAGK